MSSRLRLPRQIRTGTLARATPGARLRCAVLACTGAEWAGADLASGALLRNRSGGAVPDPTAQRVLQVVDVVVGTVEEAADPTRPEAIELAETTPALATLAGRRARRLLRHLAAPERSGAPLLGRWGPSVALEELDGSTPSLVVVGVPDGALELAPGPDGAPRCWITWSGVRQALPLADPVTAATVTTARGPLRGRALGEALGFRPGFAVVGLGAVRGGYAPKVLLSLLPG